jgi:hypothetical protein
MSTSLVDRGSPCNELANEPPITYETPSRSRCRVMTAAMLVGSGSEPGVIRAERRRRTRDERDHPRAADEPVAATARRPFVPDGADAVPPAPCDWRRVPMRGNADGRSRTVCVFISATGHAPMEGSRLGEGWHTLSFVYILIVKSVLRGFCHAEAILRQAPSCLAR